MTARLLRGILLGEILLAAVVAVALADRLDPRAIAAVVVALLLALPTLLVLTGYGVACAHRTRRPDGIPAARLRDGLAEWAAFVALFLAIQPFAGLVMGRDAVGRLPPGRRPVLLVHGYFCNRGLWWWLARALRARGHAVTTVDLDGPVTDIDRLADRLAARIAALLAETGADDIVLVTHSMGGLVARALLTRAPTTPVAALVTLAAPHHGTATAPLGLGRNARQMERTSPWLAALAARPLPPIEMVSLWSTGDEVVVPPASSRLDGARDIVVGRLGHLAMVFSPRVRDRLLAELDRLAPLTDAGRA